MAEGADQPGRISWKAGAILVAAAILLTLQQYLGPRIPYEWFPYDPAVPPRHGHPDAFAWWSVWSIGGYLVLPALLVLALPGERLRAYGLVPPDLRRQLPVYAAVLALGLAAGWIVSEGGWFDAASPLGRRGTAGGERWRWWALAAAQIVAIEFFYRGFLLEGLRKVMGGNAVFVMVVPFAMNHFHKPMDETWFAIALGLGLGWLALRLRSIWAGVAIQLGFAWLHDPQARGRVRSVVDWDVLWRFLPWLGVGVVVVAAVIGVLVILRRRDHIVWRGIAALTVEQWRAIDRDPGPAAAGGAEAGRTEWKIGVILVVCCISLALQEYVGQRTSYERYFPYDPTDPDPYWSLKGFAWWTGWRVGGYLLLPMLVIALMPGERIRDYHLSLRGFTKHLWIYAVMFALILPAVWIASGTETFRHTYPFYRLANRSMFDYWAWELMYALQFLSLEFFFRGVLLHGLRRALGANAIFVMVVPYCMIHYGKPMAETMGAIGAGVILGTLAMRTRSIWGGVVIHVCVAWTMDALAIRSCPEDGRPCRP